MTSPPATKEHCKLKRSQSLLEMRDAPNHDHMHRLGVVLVSLLSWLFLWMASCYYFIDCVNMTHRPVSKSESAAKHNSLGNHFNWKTTDSFIVSEMDDAEWQVYLGFIIWSTVLVSGLGTEVLVNVMVLMKEGWTKQWDQLWVLGQFFFPMFAMTSLGLAVSRNFMALPFLLIGLWKFGFPETILYQYMGLYGESPFLRTTPSEPSSIHTTLSQHLRNHELIRSTAGRISNLLNGTGTVLHHGASSFVISMFLAGVITPNRNALSCILFLVLQHLFLVLEHMSMPLFVLTEVALEIAFEWCVLSDFEYIASNHWTASTAAAMMLVSHWQYFLAGGLGMLAQRLGEEKDDVHGQNCEPNHAEMQV